jgi:hypothetical protein
MRPERVGCYVSHSEPEIEIVAFAALLIDGFCVWGWIPVVAVSPAGWCSMGGVPVSPEMIWTVAQNAAIWARACLAYIYL